MTNTSNIYSEIKTNIDGQQIIRLHNKTDFFKNRLRKAINNKKDAYINGVNNSYKYNKVNIILSYSGTVIPFITMFFLVYYNIISLPVGIFLFQISGNMMYFTNQIVPAAIDYSNMRISYLNLSEYINKRETQSYVNDNFKMSDGINIYVDNLKVIYSNNEQYMLDIKNINFIDKKLTLLMGPSGCGKTSLIKAIMNLIEFQGNLRAEDNFNSNIITNEIYKMSSYMPQSTQLFKTTILNNITCGSNEYSADEIIQLSKEIGAHDFISNKTEGYKTLIDEEHENLSGGEIQKILLLRALIKKSRIIFLDEPSSNLDMESINKLISVLSKLKNKKNIVLISHDLEMLEYSDWVIYLNEGKVLYNGLPKSKKEFIADLSSKF